MSGSLIEFEFKSLICYFYSVGIGSHYSRRQVAECSSSSAMLLRSRTGRMHRQLVGVSITLSLPGAHFSRILTYLNVSILRLFWWPQPIKLMVFIVCNGQDAETCLGTYDTNQSYWTNTTVDNAARSWEWIVCNEVGYLQEGPPAGLPAIVSRLIQPIYDERQCQQYFPEAFSTPPTPNAYATNDVYHGWDVKVDRLFFANGRRTLLHIFCVQ